MAASNGRRHRANEAEFVKLKRETALAPPKATLSCKSPDPRQRAAVLRDNATHLK